VVSLPANNFGPRTILSDTHIVYLHQCILAKVRRVPDSNDDGIATLLLNLLEDVLRQSRMAFLILGPPRFGAFCARLVCFSFFIAKILSELSCSCVPLPIPTMLEEHKNGVF
jgi:hypothetical protein